MTDDEAMQWLTDDERGVFTPSSRKYLVALALARSIIHGVTTGDRAGMTGEQILNYGCPNPGCPGRSHQHRCSNLEGLHPERAAVAARALNLADARFFMKAFYAETKT